MPRRGWSPPREIEPKALVRVPWCGSYEVADSSPAWPIGQADLRMRPLDDRWPPSLNRAVTAMPAGPATMLADLESRGALRFSPVPTGLACSNSCSNPSSLKCLQTGPSETRGTLNRAKTLENGLGGRDRLDFGTVRPRVQIPGPRPKIVFKSRSSTAPSGARGSHGGRRLSWNYVAA